jgi:hypothetical protein
MTAFIKILIMFPGFINLLVATYSPVNRGFYLAKNTEVLKLGKKFLLGALIDQNKMRHPSEVRNRPPSYIAIYRDPSIGPNIRNRYARKYDIKFANIN